MAPAPDDHEPEDRAPDDVAPGGQPPTGDVLPEDLDVTAYVGRYTFPNLTRRRLAGAIYLVIAGACTAGWWWGARNAGLLGAAAALVVIAAYHFAAAWDCRVDQTEALAVASRTAGFPVGHASAQLGFRGPRSRPSWRILLYSAEDPPSMRGLVELDAVDGRVLGEYTEPNPEDWSRL